MRKRGTHPRTGNVPANSRLLGKLAEWALYERPSSNADFRNLKLITRMPRVKANYWLAMNIPTSRMVSTGDWKLLQAQLPDVARWVCDQLMATWPKQLELLDEPSFLQPERVEHDEPH